MSVDGSAPPARCRPSSPRGACASTRTVFIGVGRPSTAAILARMVHNPALVLVYESGTIGAKPFHIPLSIGDGELAETADAVVSVPEMFNYWIGAGADRRRLPRRGPDRPLRQPQLDRDRRLRPPADAPARAPAARPRSRRAAARWSSIAPHATRTFVERLDFVTTVGHGDGPGARERLGLRGAGPTAVITDLGVLEPDPRDARADAHPDPPGRRPWTRSARRPAGSCAVADELRVTEPPTDDELDGAAGAARAMSDAYIFEAVRTPFGRYGGALAGVRPDDLAAHVVRALLDRAPALDPARSTTSCSATRTRPARTTATSPGWPCSSPACRRRVPGVDDQPPVRLEPRRGDPGQPRRSRPATRDVVARRRGRVDEPRAVGAAQAREALPARARGAATRRRSAGAWSTRDMPAQWTISLGESAEKLAGIYGDLARGPGRVRAAQPPERRAAWDEGFYAEWVIPVPGTELERDESIRADTSLEKLAELEAGVRRRTAR